MREKYEISLWEDKPTSIVVNQGQEDEETRYYLEEKKLCVIGSDTMTSNTRAIEPKLINNVNGTNTFSFKMYYYYTDQITGEQIQNPFTALLFNERKVKVFWKDVWYDFLIKRIEEDSAGKSAVYTCEDVFITELSKNGYNLEFSSDLQNNTDTAANLVSRVLEETDWSYDSVGSEKLLQETEEPVYEVTLLSALGSVDAVVGSDVVTIPSGEKILLFNSEVNEINVAFGVDSAAAPSQIEKTVQFVYASQYLTEENDMLVTNGTNYQKPFVVVKSDGIITFKDNSTNIMEVKLTRDSNADKISDKYRANKYTDSQKTTYSELFDRYVGLYTYDSSGTTRTAYGFETTTFNDPTAVINLVSNPCNFKNLSGWSLASGSGDLELDFWPALSSSGNSKSYLRFKANSTYSNNGFAANKMYLTPTDTDIKHGETGGLHVGDEYILRLKGLVWNLISNKDKIETLSNFTPSIIDKSNVSYFNVATIPSGSDYYNSEWVSYKLTCNKACVPDDLDSLSINIAVHSNAMNGYGIEEMQVFKLVSGKTTNGDTVMLEPNNLDGIGVQKQIYRFYDSETIAETAEKVQFLYEGEEPTGFTPIMTGCEKIATIEASKSNRFNILQSIAQNFKCWVRFIIEHDSTGKVVVENGIPKKQIRLVKQVGEDLGWSFEYGIDLKTIKRKVISDQLTTKVIVLPNSNQFAKNGFCTIARSSLNMPRENFILNFDYYISQGLLSRKDVERDLYGTNEGDIGYFFYLNRYNSAYDEATELLSSRELELLKRNSQLTIYNGQISAIDEQITELKAKIMALADNDVFESTTEPPQYSALDYARDHTGNETLSNLLSTYYRCLSDKNRLTSERTALLHTIANIEDTVDTLKSTQQTYLQSIEKIHKDFFLKYHRYIQEGTWQSENYVDDDKYYLDALDVAYTSSKPQLQYDISVMRLAALEDFSSKVFNVGDACYIVDRTFFGYLEDGITPYKVRIIISEITSNFDSPEKDVIKVQNYKTQFEDLFQRITATTQSLQYQQGEFQRAASVVNPDKTLSFALLQDTFDYNQNLVLNATNQLVTWDSTGITITDDKDAAQKLRLMAGGLFITNDGGYTWKNAVRGDGISTDVLTAGSINTSEIFMYDGNAPAFRWDGRGLNAYFKPTGGSDFTGHVTFDQFGIYGYNGTQDFVPQSETAIWDNNDVKFALTWHGFFIKNSSGNSSLKISDTIYSHPSGQDGSYISGLVFELENTSTETQRTTDDYTNIYKSSKTRITADGIVLSQIQRPQTSTNTVETERVILGKINNNDYGFQINDADGYSIFTVYSDADRPDIGFAGWNLTKDSFYHKSSYGTNPIEIGFYPMGKQAAVIKKQTLVEDTVVTEDFGTDYFYILAGDSDDGYRFGVATDGTIYATNAQIAFDLSAATGTIGGWHINENSLSATKGGYTATLGSGTTNEFLSLKYGNSTIFSVSNTGVVTCKDIQIYGEDSKLYGMLNVGTDGVGFIGETNSAQQEFYNNGAQFYLHETNGYKMAADFIENYNAIDNSVTPNNYFTIPVYRNEIVVTNAGARMSSVSSLPSGSAMNYAGIDFNSFVTTSTGCYVIGDFYINGAQASAGDSDLRLKTNIDYNINKFESFYKDLKPVNFEFKKNPGQKQFGFIAQDVLESEKKFNLDKGGLSLARMGDKYYYLDYNSFISLNTYMIQKLLKRVDELESKLAALE